MSALDRARKRLDFRRGRLNRAKWALVLLKKRIANRKQRVANTEATVRRLESLATKGVWHPGATRSPYPDAGPFVTGKPKLVWHTTEGTSLPMYSGSAPHFTLNPRTGALWQHIAIDRSAKSLEHPGGTVETNRAHAIQVELIGFARDTQNWPDSTYASIAELARWIEAHTGVKRTAGGLTYTGATTAPRRMSPDAWLDYNGHCGHQHVPNNHHWDPGAFRIERVV